MPIPKKERLLYKNVKFPPAGGDLLPVLRERQSVLVLGKGRLPLIVVLLPQVAMGDLFASSDFLSRARSLLTRKFRVAIYGTIGFRPIDCAFRD
jgi:hypothetical protein